jgi:diketogulonate reductase-like aldo/keto reductase
LPRQDLFIVSKVLPQNSTYAGTLKACDASLKRLRTDYLDCYLLHWRGSVPLADTMRALEKLVDDGKIRSLGVSNFDVDDLEEALSVLQKHKIACNQVLYNLHTRGIERDLVPFCAKHSAAIVGYTPFARKSIPSEGTAAGATLASIAKKHQVTERQVILYFLVRLDNSFAIPKAARFEHLSENAGAGAVHLDAEDIAGLDAAFPAPQKRVPLATL